MEQRFWWKWLNLFLIHMFDTFIILICFFFVLVHTTFFSNILIFFWAVFDSIVCRFWRYFQWTIEPLKMIIIEISIIFFCCSSFGVIIISGCFCCYWCNHGVLHLYSCEHEQFLFHFYYFIYHKCRQDHRQILWRCWCVFRFFFFFLVHVITVIFFYDCFQHCIYNTQYTWKICVQRSVNNQFSWMFLR